MEQPAALQAEGLEKRFGHTIVLRNINLRLDPGDFLTLCGPNGAGKTTLVCILATLVRPTAGRVLIGGLDVRLATAQIRQCIATVAHQTFLYRDLTAEENLVLYARLYDLPQPRSRAREALARAGLLQRARDPVRTLSRGLQQRLTIARALLHEPAILLLDEPYSGLDAQSAAELTALLRDQATAGRTVLLATHDLEQGLELANRVAILNAGRLVHEQPASGLTAASFRRLYLDVITGGRP